MQWRHHLLSLLPEQGMFSWLCALSRHAGTFGKVKSHLGREKPSSDFNSEPPPAGWLAPKFIAHFLVKGTLDNRKWGPKIKDSPGEAFSQERGRKIYFHIGMWGLYIPGQPDLCHCGSNSTLAFCKRNSCPFHWELHNSWHICSWGCPWRAVDPPRQRHSSRRQWGWSHLPVSSLSGSELPQWPSVLWEDDSNTLMRYQPQSTHICLTSCILTLLSFHYI